MKLAVIGSRNFTNKAILESTLTTFCAEHNISEIVSGGAINRYVNIWACQNDVDFDTVMDTTAETGVEVVLAFVVPEECPNTACRTNTIERGMTCYFCDGRGWTPSRGTADSLRKAQAAGKPCWVVIAEGKGEVIEWR